MKRNLKDIFDSATPDELDIISYKLESEEIEDATLESIKEKVFAKTNLKRSLGGKGKWIWSAAVAAVLCFAVGLAAIVHRTPTTLKLEPIPAVMTVGDRLTGRQELSFIDNDIKEAGEYSCRLVSPGFYIGTVIEAEIIEVYPDLYSYGSGYDSIFNSDNTCHVAKVKVIESFNTKGLPEEIFISYRHYGADIFDGYERFIMSLDQVGVENYLLINETQRRIDYFSNMFESALVDIGYGSFIAFNDNKVDTTFWKKANYMDSYTPNLPPVMERVLDEPGMYVYPATRTSTLKEVKDNVRRQIKAKSKNYPNRRYDNRNYLTSDDIFVSEEATKIRGYVKPGKNNVFSYTLTVYSEGIKVVYTRLVNGFQTNEVITIWEGGDGNRDISVRGGKHNSDDLKKMPDIAGVIEDLKIMDMKPPRVDPVKFGLDLKSVSAEGIYRKIDGKIYGIVRVLWVFTDGKANARDAVYYLYDESGEGRVISEEELKAIIGDDKFIINTHLYSKFYINY